MLYIGKAVLRHIAYLTILKEAMQLFNGLIVTVIASLKQRQIYVSLGYATNAFLSFEKQTKLTLQFLLNK
jgi:hypothetical protein